MNAFWDRVCDAAGVPRVKDYLNAPAWVRHVALTPRVEHAVYYVSTFRTAGPEVQAAVEAAHKMGGYEAVREFVRAFMAQG